MTVGAVGREKHIRSDIRLRFAEKSALSGLKSRGWSFETPQANRTEH